MPSRGIHPLRVSPLGWGGRHPGRGISRTGWREFCVPSVSKGRTFGVFEMSLFNRFRKNESGATAVEYGLIIALIAAVSVGTIKTIGTNLNTKFNIINSNLN
jgi:pilus assembly protein Flp/PilA